MNTYECQKCHQLSFFQNPCECENSTVNDPVNHPAHYTTGKIEVIDFIDDKELTYCLGNAVKYIARAGKKNPDKTVEDLQKAAWYINHEIERMER